MVQFFILGMLLMGGCSEDRPELSSTPATTATEETAADAEAKDDAPSENEGLADGLLQEVKVFRAAPSCELRPEKDRGERGEQITIELIVNGEVDVVLFDRQPVSGDQRSFSYTFSEAHTLEARVENKNGFDVCSIDLNVEAAGGVAVDCTLAAPQATITAGTSLNLDFVPIGPVQSVSFGPPMAPLDQPGAQQIPVAPDEPTTFIATVNGPGGASANCSVPVSVVPVEAPDCTLTIAGGGVAEVVAGQAISLAFSPIGPVTGAVSLFDDRTLAPAGETFSVSPSENGSISVRVTGANGSNVCSSPSITVVEPETLPDCHLDRLYVSTDPANAVRIALTASGDYQQLFLEGSPITNGSSRLFYPSSPQPFNGYALANDGSQIACRSITAGPRPQCTSLSAPQTVEANQPFTVHITGSSGSGFSQRIATSYPALSQAGSVVTNGQQQFQISTDTIFYGMIRSEDAAGNPIDVAVCPSAATVRVGAPSYCDQVNLIQSGDDIIFDVPDEVTTVVFQGALTPDAAGGFTAGTLNRSTGFTLSLPPRVPWRSGPAYWKVRLGFVEGPTERCPEFILNR